MMLSNVTCSDIGFIVNILKWLIKSHGLNIPVYNFTEDKKLKIIK